MCWIWSCKDFFFMMGAIGLFGYMKYENKTVEGNRCIEKQRAMETQRDSNSENNISATSQSQNKWC